MDAVPPMTLNTLFLLLDEHPQQLMFICPCCEHQNFVESTLDLAALRCAACGLSLNASDAELEVLTANPAVMSAPSTRPSLFPYLQ
jgi:hypothetical protein